MSSVRNKENDQVSKAEQKKQNLCRVTIFICFVVMIPLQMILGYYFYPEENRMIKDFQSRNPWYFQSGE